MKENKFLVVGLVEDSEFSEIMTAHQIFEMMEMEDCYEIHIDIWHIRGYGEALESCSFHGKWHDHKDPLRMVIVGDGIREVGYAEEH